MLKAIDQGNKSEWDFLKFRLELRIFRKIQFWII